MCELETTNNGCKRCNERLLSVAETAAMLGIGEKTIRNKLSARTFPISARKYGKRVLFRLSEIV